jgi:hypothetical protein
MPDNALANFNKLQAQIKAEKQTRYDPAQTALERINIGFDALIDPLDAYRDASILAISAATRR